MFKILFIVNWGYVFGKKVGIFNIFHFEEKNGWLNWKLVLLVTLKLERIRDMIHQGSFQSADLKWLRLLSNYLRVNILQIFQETIRVTKSAGTSNIYLYLLFSMYLIGYLLTIRNCLENIETCQALVCRCTMSMTKWYSFQQKLLLALLPSSCMALSKYLCR